MPHYTEEEKHWIRAIAQWCESEHNSFFYRQFIPIMKLDPANRDDVDVYDRMMASLQQYNIFHNVRALTPAGDDKGAPGSRFGRVYISPSVIQVVRDWDAPVSNWFEYYISRLKGNRWIALVLLLFVALGSLGGIISIINSIIQWLTNSQ